MRYMVVANLSIQKMKGTHGVQNVMIFAFSDFDYSDVQGQTT